MIIDEAEVQGIALFLVLPILIFVYNTSFKLLLLLCTVRISWQ